MGHRDGAVEAVGDVELGEPLAPDRQTRRAHPVNLGIAVRQFAHGREHGGGDVGGAFGFVALRAFEQRCTMARFAQAPTEQTTDQARANDSDAHCK